MMRHSFKKKVVAIVTVLALLIAIVSGVVYKNTIELWDSKILYYTNYHCNPPTNLRLNFFFLFLTIFNTVIPLIKNFLIITYLFTTYFWRMDYCDN